MKLYEYVVCIIRKGLASHFCPLIARVSAPALITFYKYISISYFCLIYAAKSFVCLHIFSPSFPIAMFFCHCVMWHFLVPSLVTWPFQDGCRHGSDSMVDCLLVELILFILVLDFQLEGYVLPRLFYLDVLIKGLCLVIDSCWLLDWGFKPSAF